MFCYARIVLYSFRRDIISAASFIQTATALQRQSARLLSLRATFTTPPRAPARVSKPVVSLTALAQTVLFCQRSQEGGTAHFCVGGECVYFYIHLKDREFCFFSPCRTFQFACHHFLQKRAGLFSASFPGAPQQANSWRGRGHRHDRGAGHRNSASDPDLSGFSALRNDGHLSDDL